MKTKKNNIRLDERNVLLALKVIAVIEDDAMIDFITEKPEDMVVLSKVIMDMVTLGVDSQIISGEHSDENDVIRIAAKYPKI
jgi:hypothetical protein